MITPKPLVITILFVVLAAASLLLPPAVALFIGIAFALIFTTPYPALVKKTSKYLLQVAVVGLGFGMNLHRSLQAGKEGLLFTIVSVTGVMLLGYLLGKWLGIPRKLAHLISSGTAICGGSAIAAVAPVVKADSHETSMSLAVIFTLNAIALFIFPPLGHLLGLSQEQFGLWAAIAIHDTSSVVGAGQAYGAEALAIATTVKLTRALWIIPLAFVSMLMFRSQGQKVAIPWFILLFVVAMAINTYLTIPEWAGTLISQASHRALSLTLFLIGSGLSVAAIKQVGHKPILLGVGLWIIISLSTLAVVMAK